MTKIARCLTDYIIRKGMVEEAERETYEYGVTLFLELGIFAIYCVVVSLCLHMYVEGILFFVIFSPLRSYAGGLHLKRYGACFVLSVVVYSVVLLAVRYVELPLMILLPALFLLEIAVCMLYPVENVNRRVDEDENQYFKVRLWKFLGVDLFIGIICGVLSAEKYLLEIDIVFLLVVVSMIIGKCINRKQKDAVELS